MGGGHNTKLTTSAWGLGSCPLRAPLWYGTYCGGQCPLPFSWAAWGRSPRHYPHRPGMPVAFARDSATPSPP